MQAKKLFLISFIVASMVGCASSTTTSNDAKKIELTQSEIDLMLKKARSEERVLVIKELEKQNQQKIVFDELLIKEGKEPKFTEHYQQPLNQKKLFEEIARKQIEAEIQQGIRVNSAEGGISKIKPLNRKVTLYQNINGINYYRCAANAMIPIKSEQGTRYHFSKKELSATLCKKSRNKTVMLELQNRLYALGYLKSDVLNKAQLVDGVWGTSTLEAVKAYQADNELLFGQMTIQTLEHIGVFANYSDNSFEAAKLAKVAEIGSTEISKDLTDLEQKSNTEKKTATTNKAIDQNLSESKVAINHETEGTQVSKTTEPSLLEVEQSEQNAEQNVIKESKNRLVDQRKQREVPAKATLINGQYVLKITPENRKRAFYQTVGGARYYRCAANAMIGIKSEKGKWQYHKDRKELSATLCKSSRDEATMTDLQYELYEKGYMPANGTPIGFLISGKWDQRTLKAVKAYQAENGLLYGQLTIETLESLGIFKPHKERILELEKTNSIVTEGRKEKTVDQPAYEPIMAKKVAKKVTKAEQIPFVPLKVRFVDTAFDASNFVPKTSVAKPYAYVGNFALKRCRARSMLPIKTEEGVVYNNENKAFRATLCKFNRTSKLMTRLQTALRDKGFLRPLAGQTETLIDRSWNQRTLNAVKAYQKHHGLLYGQLSIEVLEHLGVFIEKE